MSYENQRWRLYSETVTLAGGFTCKLTPDERNEWHEHLTVTNGVTYLNYVTANCQIRQAEHGVSGTLHRAVSDCTKVDRQVYRIAKDWFAGLCERRKAADDAAEVKS